MISEVVDTSTHWIELLANVYRPGDAPTIYYRTAASVAGVALEAWTEYTAIFQSAGFVQVKVEN